VVEQRLVLRPSELADNYRRLAHGLGTIASDVARRWRIDAHGVESVAEEIRLDDVAGARVDVLGHAVEVDFPDEFVGPGMIGEIEDLGFAAGGIADRGALVARGGEVVFARGERGQVLPVLHARPDDEHVGVGGVDGVGACGHVAYERLPVVVQIGNVPRFAQLVAKGHADDVGVVLRPFGDVGEAAAPVGGVEIEVIEPGVAVDVGAAPLRFSDVDVGADKDTLGRSNASDVAPDLEACGLGSPAGVLLDDFVGDFGAIYVAKGVNHGDFKRHVFAVAIVDLVDHFNGVAHANVIEAHARNVVQDLFCRCPFKTLRNHGLACSGWSVYVSYRHMQNTHHS